MKLEVYSLKTQKSRTVTLIPSFKWDGDGCLGVSIRFCEFLTASNCVWRILTVDENSPAAKAGLLAKTDFIIATDSALTKVIRKYL